MPVEMRVPQITQTMTEAEIVRWFKAEGDQVKVGEPLLEVVTDKATVDVESPATGVLSSILLERGVAPVGTVIAVIAAPGEAVAAPSDPTGSPAATPPAASTMTARAPAAAPVAASPARIRISPLAKRIAQEKGIDVSHLVPSGPGGLIVERDVKRYLEEAPLGAGSGAAPPAPAPSLPEGVSPASPAAAQEAPKAPPSPDEEVIPLAGVRRIIADRMTISRHTAADVTTVAEVDMGEVAALREHLPFTVTSFVARAVALALCEYPILNSRLEGDRIIVSKRVHLGVAVAIDEGLKVPVLRDAQAMTLRQISLALQDKAQRGSEGKLAPEELTGSTFTLTNSGVFGSLFFTPIINPPESAILGMGKIVKTPVVRDDQIVIRPMMYLCLTYDHRVVDGAPAVKFLQRVKGLLEKPDQLV